MSSIRDHVPRTPKDEKLERIVKPLLDSLRNNGNEARKMYDRLTKTARDYLRDHYIWADQAIKYSF